MWIDLVGLEKIPLGPRAYTIPKKWVSYIIERKENNFF